MRPWELIQTTTVPGQTGELRLYRQGDAFSIKAGRCELMNSHTHGSEDALAELACQRLGQRPRVQILIGGLGMGFTLAAVLRQLGPDAKVVVAELVPAVIAWNRDLLAALAGRPLDFDEAVYLSESQTGFRNRAIGYLLRNFNIHCFNLKRL